MQRRLKSTCIPGQQQHPGICPRQTQPDDNPMPSPEQESLSVDQLNVLYRLYIEWPQSTVLEGDKEANEFYLWLKEELGDEFSDLVNNLNEIKTFIRLHQNVLGRARYIKSRLMEVQTNARTDPRMDINTQVFFLVYDCQENPALEGTIQRGILLDIARNGMRVESNIAIPRGTVLSLTVAQVNWDVRLYHLTGDVRWSIDHDDSKQVGISIFNIGDYKEWQDYYELTTMS